MRIARNGAGVAVMLTLFSVGWAATLQRAPLQPIWERVFDRVHGIALSSGAQCAAVTTNDSLLLIGRDGRDLWRWDFRAGNRLLTANDVAVSPACDWAAFTGDSGYKYVSPMLGAALISSIGAPASEAKLFRLTVQQ